MPRLNFWIGDHLHVEAASALPLKLRLVMSPFSASLTPSKSPRGTPALQLLKGKPISSSSFFCASAEVEGEAAAGIAVDDEAVDDEAAPIAAN